jgi:hypothetical protein
MAILLNFQIPEKKYQRCLQNTATHAKLDQILSLRTRKHVQPRMVRRRTFCFVAFRSFRVRTIRSPSGTNVHHWIEKSIPLQFLEHVLSIVLSRSKVKFCKRVMQRVIVMDPPVTPVKMKIRPTKCRGLSLILVWQRHWIQHRSSCGVLGDESEILTDLDLFCAILYSVTSQLPRNGYLVPLELRIIDTRNTWKNEKTKRVLSRTRRWTPFLERSYRIWSSFVCFAVFWRHL